MYTLLEVLEPLWTALGSAVPCLGIYPRETCTCAQGGIDEGAHGSIVIAKHWKLSKCPSIQEWLDEFQHVYAMEYYIVIEKHEMYLFVLRKQIIHVNSMNPGGLIFSVGCPVYS